MNLSFAGPGNSVADIFVPLDLNVANRFEFLLVGNQIDYRINGRRYTGIAQATGSRILVIGDGSGSTRTGSGSMLVSNVSPQTMPAFAELVDMAPEPASWAMLIIGFGLTGAMMRRRREAAAAPAA